MSEQEQAYTGYTSLDFFEDDRYIRFILHPDAGEAAYWANVSENSADRAAAMEEARVWILLLNRQPVQTPAKGKEQAWQQLTQRIDTWQQQRTRYVVPLKRASVWVGSVAAVLMAVWVLREWTQHGTQQFATDFGKLREVVLPDESVVTLNGNSNVHYNRGWKTSKPREMWLQGEAFFNVKHVAVQNRWQQSDSFLVHVNGLNLTVTGTKFNVKSRRSAIEVTLLEGGLRVDKDGVNAFSKVLKPGDVFVYDTAQTAAGQLQVNPLSRNAWTRRELELDGYTLLQLLQILEDTYGYDITLQSPELADKKLTGTIPASSGEDILFVLQKTLGLRVSRNGNRLVISKI